MSKKKIHSLSRKGFKKAEKITKKHAKTFYFTSHLLPKERRKAAFSVYAICRISDDTVDNPAESLASLESIEKKIKAAYSNAPLEDGILVAFKQTITKYRIPKQYFDELIDGMYMDVEKNRYKNFDELYTYCYKVAGIIGLIMLYILGYNNPEAKTYAVKLGIAMQLTNILRDIKEDYQRGRIYVPQDEMKQFGVSEETIAEGKISDQFIHLLKFQIKRADSYYSNARQGLKLINNAPSRLVVCMMAYMYEAILRKIEENSFDVFSKRAYVSNLKKIGIGLTILGKAKFV